MTCKSLSGVGALDFILRDKVLLKQAICILLRSDKDREVLHLHVGRLMMIHYNVAHGMCLAWSVKAASFDLASTPFIRANASLSSATPLRAWEVHGGVV